MASCRMGSRLRLATAQSNVEKTVEIRLTGTTIVSHRLGWHLEVSRRLCWRLAVEEIVGNNRCSSTTVSRRLGWRLDVEGIVGHNCQK